MLSKGIRTCLSTRVLAVETQNIRIKVSWERSEGSANADPFEDSFDHVILAVPPNVVGKIFAPLSYEMSGIPTTMVRECRAQSAERSWRNFPCGHGQRSSLTTMFRYRF